jgi:hypothetical protein
MFKTLRFVRVELNLPHQGEGRPARWWECQEWLATQGAMPLSNIMAEYHEMGPQPQYPADHVWWDCFDDTDRWSWYFPESRKDLAALFKLTFGGSVSSLTRCA